MAGNLSVAFTGDTTDITAKAAVAKEQVRQYAAELRSAAAEAKASGASFNEQAAAIQGAASKLAAATTAYKGYTSELANARSAQSGVTSGLKEATGAMYNHGAATEAMVLVHEAMSGRFSKMGGSLMILTQRIAGNSAAMMGLAGAFGVAAMGAMHLVEWLDKVANARLVAEAGGFRSGISTEQLDAQVAKLTRVKEVTSELAGATVHTFGQMKGVSQEVLDSLTSDVRALSLVMKTDVSGAAEKVAQAWSLDAKAGEELLEKTGASLATIKAWTAAAENNRAGEARKIMLRELSRNEVELSEKTRAGTAEQIQAETIRKQIAEARARGEVVSSVGQQFADSIKDTATTEAADRLAVALHHVSDEMKAPAAIPWAERTRAELAEVTLAAVEHGRAQHETWQKIAEDRIGAEVKFWSGALEKTREGSKEQLEAKRSLFQAEEQLDMMKSRHEGAEGKKSVEAKVAELGAEQAAAGENFARVMEIEDQKLSILRSAYREDSKQYQDELRHKEELLKAHTTRVTSETLAHLAKVREVDQSQVADLQSVLATEVADHLITKQSELAQVLSFATAKHASELSGLTDLIGTLDKETEAYRKAIDEKDALEARHKRVVDALRLQMAQADRQDQQRALTQWEQTFAGIESAGMSSASELIKGTMTWQQAETRVAGAVLDSAVKLGGQLVARWTATQVAETFATESGVAQRVAAEQASGASGWGPILARWIGLEHAKTVTTTAGAATRAGAETGGGLIAAIGRITGLWGASEVAKTTATTAGALARTGAEATAAATIATAGAAERVSEVVGLAPVAAAGAYAATAVIPVVGPELAPAAAAVAGSAVAAMAPAAALAVGTSYVPRDMNALIHQGEIVVPRFESDMIRDGRASLGGADGGGGGDTHVHLHLSAIDTQSGLQFVQQHMQTIARGVGKHMTRNPSSRPTH